MEHDVIDAHLAERLVVEQLALVVSESPCRLVAHTASMAPAPAGGQIKAAEDGL
jgi:hypothetical protein